VEYIKLEQEEIQTVLSYLRHAVADLDADDRPLARITIKKAADYLGSFLFRNDRIVQ
jgi:hypothetical protein